MLTEEQSEKVINACLQALLLEFRPESPGDAFKFLSKLICIAAHLSAGVVKDRQRTLAMLDQIREYVASEQVTFNVKVMPASALHEAPANKH